MKIDLNCDMGEGCGNDAALMPLISSANIACGVHAGNKETMRRTIDLALEHGVAIGAHPGYPDRGGFGRTAVEMPPEEVFKIVSDQILELAAIAAACGTKLAHIKPHGALYNRSAADAETASAIAKAVLEVDRDLVLFGLAGSLSISTATEIGLTTAAEAFADRTYQSNGMLTPRSRNDALIRDAATASEQALDLIKYGRVRSTEGVMLKAEPTTICIHGDGASAVEFATRIHDDLTKAKIIIEAVNG